jgi:hypothetical protein
MFFLENGTLPNFSRESETNHPLKTIFVHKPVATRSNLIMVCKIYTAKDNNLE